ncbi:leucine-rich repeat-containing protein 43 isoform X2 [Pogoniulus pusillus]|uniref:leucine-rich repeat-containing protein 43 isoform X2 n=1 Tax=Pogoniulus pusillus TaxID=488313 RepID=UPI0030B91CF1
MNKSRFDARTSPSRSQPGQEESVMLDEENPEMLMELLQDPHSPWALPPDCSSQDQYLREVAVLAPELVCGSNIFQVLSTLRIVGKGVEEVDEGLLQLQKLEELILSANQISRITSANLPRTLKVLELCCNAVADLQDLCTQPPPELQHLGLGYNKLCGPSQNKYLSVDFWPNLVSLDLSFNSFMDLLELISQLSSLQKLRILVLQGNPLALIPTYRGFVVDSLPKLSILDDIHIGPEERHQFQGLARQPELIRSEAQLVVSIGEIKGVPNPSTHQQLEVDSEAPVITYSYCVTYEFLEGDETGDSCSTEETKICQHPVVVTLDMDSSAQDIRETMSQQMHTTKEESKVPSAVLCSCTAKVFVTPGKPWAVIIDCSYRKEHTIKDLMGLKSYLEAGTIVSVVEEKVLSWPVSADPEENAVIKGKGPVPRDKQKKKKKKKEKPCELRSDPPIQRTLGTGRVILEALLATEDSVATVCDFGILITEQPVQPPSLEEKDGKKSKSKSKKPKAEREGHGSRKTTASAEGKRKTKDSAELEEGHNLQPVPLTVQFQMQLLRWPMTVGSQSLGEPQ